MCNKKYKYLEMLVTLRTSAVQKKNMTALEGATPLQNSLTFNELHPAATQTTGDNQHS
jgi:hypothetical protein